jgi:hypothetical protein
MLTHISTASKKCVIKGVIACEEHLTLCIFVCADGTALKPGVILPKLKNLPPLHSQLESQFVWSGTSSGWITEHVFRRWVEEVVK